MGISRKDLIDASTAEDMEQERRLEECPRDKAERQTESKRETGLKEREEKMEESRKSKGAVGKERTVLFNKTCSNLWSIHFAKPGYCLS